MTDLERQIEEILDAAREVAREEMAGYEHDAHALADWLEALAIYMPKVDALERRVAVLEHDRLQEAQQVTASVTLRYKNFNIVSRAVEEGIALGIRHAYKHTDDPSHDLLESCLNGDVMNALCEIINFEEGEG